MITTMTMMTMTMMMMVTMMMRTRMRMRMMRMMTLYCRTLEDLPSPPANIKAVPVSVGSILVTWLPPTLPAGEITGYAIHLSTMMAGQTITDKIEVRETRATPPVRQSVNQV